VALILLNSYTSHVVRRRVLFISLIVELLVIFIFPAFYADAGQPPKSANPFAGADYISWLRKRNPDTYRVFARNAVLFPNWAGVFGLYDVRSLDAMYDAKYLPFLRAFLQAPAGPTELFDRFTGFSSGYSFESAASKRLLQLSSIRYLISDTPFENAGPDLKPVYHSDARIYEYERVLPRAAVLYRVEFAPEREQILKRLLDPAHDVFRTALVLSSSVTPDSGERVRAVNVGPAREFSAATIKSYSSRCVDIEVSLDQPGLLTLNDTDYPGWHAYVDGHEHAILNVNYLFRGVALESGFHRISFRYEPGSFRSGLAISALSVIALAVLAGRRVHVSMASMPSMRRD
jgi:hypothetical protein